MFSSHEYLWLLTNMCTQGFPSTPLLTAIKEASNFSTSFTIHNTALKINKLNNLWPHCGSNKILGFWSCHSPRVKITSTGNIWTQTFNTFPLFLKERLQKEILFLLLRGFYLLNEINKQITVWNALFQKQNPVRVGFRY